MGTPASASSSVTVPDLASAARAVRKAARLSCSPVTILGATGPALHALAATASTRCGMVGKNKVEGYPSQVQTCRTAWPKTARYSADLAAPAARQHQQDRRLRLTPRQLLRVGPQQRRDLLGEGMTDIAAGQARENLAIFIGLRTATARVRGRHSAASRAPCPAATPRPSARHSR